ncbi:MAG: hypothetical protein QM533_13315 [Cytophagales bacterium]|nr:hypothetical protein [Cytophagales bacterium]
MTDSVQTDAGELKTFAQLGITSINLQATNQSGLVSGGNEVLATGSFTQTVVDALTGSARTVVKEALAARFIANPAGSTATQSLLNGVTGYTVTTDNLNANGSLNATQSSIKSYVSGNTDANSNWLAGGRSSVFVKGGGTTCPRQDAQTMGVGCRERSAAKRNVESRHLTPIGLRQFANRFGVLASSPLGDWLAGHDALQAANDIAWRVVA